MSQVPHTFIVDLIWLKISSLFLEIMVSHMVTSYRPQATQVNEELASESSLDLMLTQHPRDENPKPQKVRVGLGVDPPRTWYYRIFLNSRTLMVLLQVDLTSGDELETVCESCYEIENTSIFTWSSILGIKHYHWLRNLIHRLPLNNKAYYLVRTIRRILDFLQL
jgi:hypothetical protein